MRTFTNKPGTVYDANKTTVLFAEDLNEFKTQIESRSTDPSTLRNLIGLPFYDGVALISNPNNVIKTGWGIVDAAAPNNPEADSTFLFTKMINSNFGIQECYVRSSQKIYRRYMASGVWGSWVLVANDGVWFSYTPILSGDTGSGATMNVLMARYTRIGQTCHFTIRALLTSKGSCSGGFYVSTPFASFYTGGSVLAGGVIPIGGNITSSRGWPGIGGNVFNFTKSSQSAVLQWSDVSVNDEILISGSFEIA